MFANKKWFFDIYNFKNKKLKTVMILCFKLIKQCVIFDKT